ncbi:MmcQ/YjbR family DNA-binding protein [Ferruginibacter albus]|uniref:MmcQ/YjbR family DNA-binding protein n=1 Tax=Ferruginibacter albus TaxID=2875540 RepID=UPI001CC40E8F|nr:MmcQ/YjbR family DNA-binding protein [Ferruginibacter albus]UAY52451.1 MmcQ/YjbR family DNA-binding protein [Ferruginibacter albus]
MNVEDIRDHVLQKPGVTEGFPFGETVIVFKVSGKVFLLVPLDEATLQFNVKCDPDHAIELREEYQDNVLPGYHMNKKHWNTVIAGGRLTNKLLLQFIDDSYNLVLPKTSKKK